MLDMVKRRKRNPEFRTFMEDVIYVFYSNDTTILLTVCIDAVFTL